MLKITSLLAAFLVCGSLAHADESLIAEFDLAANPAANSQLYDPPVFEGAYGFLALAATENPYPAPLSYAAQKVMAERANSACRFLGNIGAMSVVLQASAGAATLANSYDGVFFVDTYFPVTKYTPPISVSPVSFAKLRCYF